VGDLRFTCFHVSPVTCITVACVLLSVRALVCTLVHVCVYDLVRALVPMRVSAHAYPRLVCTLS
jgi:hypothetical protein